MTVKTQGRTEDQLRERGFKILSLHMYGYRRTVELPVGRSGRVRTVKAKPDYKVVPVESDDRRGSPYERDNAAPWAGLVRWDWSARKWGAHPPLKRGGGMRQRPIRLCDTRVEAAHVLVDASGRP